MLLKSLEASTRCMSIMSLELLPYIYLVHPSRYLRHLRWDLIDAWMTWFAYHLPPISLTSQELSSSPTLAHDLEQVHVLPDCLGWEHTEASFAVFLIELWLSQSYSLEDLCVDPLGAVQLVDRVIEVIKCPFICIDLVFILLMLGVDQGFVNV